MDMSHPSARQPNHPQEWWDHAGNISRVIPGIVLPRFTRGGSKQRDWFLPVPVGTATAHAGYQIVIELRNHAVRLADLSEVEETVID